MKAELLPSNLKQLRFSKKKNFVHSFLKIFEKGGSSSLGTYLTEIFQNFFQLKQKTCTLKLNFVK